ncbi:aromatic ring-hydroxylating dioxygenase subunit alpha [Muricoccus aerilatus]|uniref:aromatic ring-hydroxylating dioxygenase subunit alpha n=1 Tax=Muricoccus aerilatus TaxID=452982 RepID=UPI0005C19EA9|nr:aromatic ring-hydroxylating dioxygenase subunit alpha [Roseomonas aerilata]
MAFIRNCWYPAAFSSAVGEGPLRRTVLGENIVLFRGEGGAIAALDDLCPHRMAPLSLGRVRGGGIECGYHGMTFDGRGACVRIPGQDTIPSRARVRSYAVAERLGLVWVWMGAAEEAEASLLVDLAQFDDPAWAVVPGEALAIGANYLSLADNLCDPSHVSFVHTSTLGNAASVGVPVRSRAEGRETVVWRWILDAPAIPVFAQTGLVQGSVDRWHYYHYHAPCVAIIDFGTAPAGLIGPDGDRDRGLRIFAVHCITPVDEGHCIDHWFHLRNFGQGDAALDAALNRSFRTAFDEDKAILEAIETEESSRPGFRPVQLAIDAAPNRMRHIVRRLIEAEAASPALQAAK